VGIVKPAPAADARPKPTYTQVFGEWLCDMARADKRLIGITPAMREGSGLVKFSQEFPDRYFDVGIAEQHAVTFAGGLAVDGMKPVVAIYSTFLQRAYDQLIHDVALQNLPVVFAMDRGGLVRRGRPDSPRRLRSLVPALHPQHDGDGALRRERMPPDALHRVHRRQSDCGALPARHRSRRRSAEADDGAADRTRRSAPRRQAHRHPRFRLDAHARARGRQRAERHRRQHALREAAGPRARVPPRHHA
jgi:hypothetical protein